MATAVPELPVLARDDEFEKLYRRYVKDVYHYSLALLRNTADAEDVTQTTFLNAYRAFQRGEEVEKPQHWLIKIAHNVARSRYSRMSRRVREVPLEHHTDALAVPEVERPDVEAVLRALGRLPFNQRAALVMRELEGRSYVEIADTLGVSVSAVETLIFRARRSLRIRTAALRSILGVPVPPSVTQLFEGGGVAVGGIGAGLVAKAVLALVAGAVATGVASEAAKRAVAASRRPAPQATMQQVASPAARKSTAPARTREAAKTAHVRRSHVDTPGSLPDVAATTEGSTAPAVVQRSSERSGSPSVPSTSGATPAPQTISSTVDDTVQTVVNTAGQVVQTATTAVPPPPVSLPPVPVQAPPLPKLP